MSQSNEGNENFEGALFLLSGSSDGMGLAIARKLVSRGANVILLARSADVLIKRKQELAREGSGQVEIAPLDIADKNTAKRAAEIVGKRKLRGVLLNAGGPEAATASSLTWDNFEQANSLVLAGPAMLINSLIPSLEAPGASVVAITSVTVKEPTESLTLSGTYRLALVAFLKHLADQLGPKGIRVNNVAPGYTKTESLKALMKKRATDLSGNPTAEALVDIEKRWTASIPLGRLASPEEIASACVYLFSQEASFITGQTLVVDGGMTRSY